MKGFYCFDHGLHFAKRLSVSQQAVKKGLSENIWSAYSEHVGVKRQHEPRSGLIKSRYAFIRPKASLEHI